MIQLIRRFLNSENTPLNRILRTGLEEVSNKMGGSDGKTLFDAIGSLNTDTTKPLNVLIDGYLSKGVVKSVQRGILTIPEDVSEKYSTTITISPVNMSKSILIYNNGSGDKASYSYNSTNPFLQLTSSTKITAQIGKYSYHATYTPWQVIEFY